MKNYNGFCKYIGCPEYKEWEYCGEKQVSCKKMGETENITVYPEDCNFINEIKFVEGLMSEIICHHKGRYNIYGTASDAFRFVESISLDQLKGLIKQEGGDRAMSGFDKRIDRAHRNGTSSFIHMSLNDFLCVNRAGKDEANLSTEQCIEQFIS